MIEVEKDQDFALNQLIHTHTPNHIYTLTAVEHVDIGYLACLALQVGVGVPVYKVFCV